MGINLDLFDASTRHAIGVRRFAAGEAKEILRLLAKSDVELQARILRTKGTFTRTRLKLLQRDMRTLRKEIFKTIRATQRKSMLEFAFAEQEFSQGIMRTVMPVDIQFAAAEAQSLRAVVNAQPFSGGPNAANTLQGWWEGVEAVDAKRIKDAVQLGVAQAETIPQIAARVATAGDLTRRNAEAVARTAVNHVSNKSREEFFKANKKVFQFLLWNSTLDGRTTAVCRGRDGHYTAVDPETSVDQIPEPHLSPFEARPPAHVSCRSLMVAALGAKGLSQKLPDRPSVRDTRTRRQREIDFRKDAKTRVGDKSWKAKTPKQRNASIRKEKRIWSEKAIGQVPGRTTYDSWLRRQPVKFQNEVLGTGKGKLFRKGLKLDKFTDLRGSELTLKQLRKKFPDFVAI